MRILTVIGIAFSLIATTQVVAQPAEAMDSSVVISEIHYKPATLDGEFVELTNPSETDIDVGGWVFSDAFDLVLAPGTTIEAGSRLVVTRDAADFLTTYGVAAAQQFTSGSLANSSDTVMLHNDVGTLIDTVTYLDEAPWPPGPDNNGTSLELASLAADNDDAAVWAESLVIGGTPGSQNTAELSSVLPTVSGISASPEVPDPNESVVISATVETATTVTLTYRIAYEPEVDVEMLDDAASVGGAADGVYSATIPSQVGGELIRYRIEATNASGAASEPTVVDARDYLGYVVNDPSFTSPIPLVQWWMPDLVYQDVLENHRYTDLEVDAVLAYDGQVWDNVQMRIRGGTSRSHAQPSWKVELPDGELFEIPGYTSMPVDEFNLQGDGEPRAAVAWQVSNAIGFPTVDYFPIEVHRNGEFWSVGSYGTALDGRWRDANGFGDANVYKATQGIPLQRQPFPYLIGTRGKFELKEGPDEGFEEVWDFSNLLDDEATQAQYGALLEELDVPKVINYLAFTAWAKDWDIEKHNFYLVNDDAGSDRWFVLPWDLDIIFRVNHGLYLEPVGVLPRRVLDHPEFAEMYNRRLRTLIDEFSLPDFPIEAYDEIYHPIADLLDASYAIYQDDDPFPERRDEFIAGAHQRRDVFADATGGTFQAPIPFSQTAARPIVISEINHAPGGGSMEFVEVTNTSEVEAFDLSGWEIEGAGVTIAPGTVLLPGAQVVFVEDDRTFRGISDGVFVSGELGDDLADSGETLTLRDAEGALVDQVSYGVSDPWPTSTLGFGRTLELIDTSLDNSLAENWAASSHAGGTPGRTNDPAAPDSLPPANPGLILNEYNAVDASKFLKGDGSDAFFGTVAGNGGDWFELVVVDDGLDVRGWELVWADDDGQGSLVFADDPTWSSLSRGTILTIAADHADDLSFAPESGDWSINVQPGVEGSGALLVGDPLQVSNSDWALTIFDGSGSSVFGPAGEGVGELGGVSSTEIARLEEDPSMTVTGYSSYDDASDSTFGQPNDVGGGDVQDFAPLRQPMAAAVIAGPFDTTAIGGGSATFEIATTGTAPVAIQWRRDGTELLGENSAVLHLEAVTLADDGALIDVVVSNGVGSVISSAATLSVLAPSGRVTDGLQALWRLDEGSGAVIHDTAGVGIPANLTIDDPAQVEWLPGGGIRLSSFVDISGPGNRLVNASVSSDEFTLEAWVDPAKANPAKSGWIAGLYESRLERNVAIAQGMFSSDPTSSLRARYKNDGKNVSATSPAGTLTGDLVHVVATRSSDGSFRMYADGVQLANQGGSDRLVWFDQSFRLGSAGPTSPTTVFEGDILAVAYYARALSPEEIQQNLQAGAALEPASPIAPAITNGPVDVTVGVGADAVFGVEVSGTPPHTYVWRRDGVEMPGETGATLTLASVQLADSGAVFEVTASNVVGSVTSAAATLTVEPVPPGITVAGDPTVTVIEGAEQLDVTWEPVAGASQYQLRYVVAPPNRIWDSPTTELARTLTGLEAGVAHTVQVRAYTTSWGPFTTVEAVPLEANVETAPPVFVVDPVDVSVGVGGDAVFSVEVSGSPVPVLQWRRDGVDLVGETGLSLSLASVQLADSGAVFDVTASNEVGSVMSAVATLTVETAPPVFVVDPVDVSVGVGGDAVFSVEVSGSPVPVLQWRRDGVDLVGETGLSLSLASVELADSGAVFDVTASNEVGSVTSAAATLTVEPVPPGITVEGDPTVTVIEGAEQLDVTWEPVAGASQYQLRYVVAGRRVWDSPTTELARTLTGLEPGVTHRVQVRAYTTSWGPFTTVEAVPT